MATEITEQIVREAKPIEDIKLALLQSAQALPSPQLPAYQVAGLGQDQIDAISLGRLGIGAYAPYLQQGTAALRAGTATMGEAADILRGADTRGQFAAAQQATNLGIGSLLGAAQGYNPYSAMAFMNPYTQSVIQESLQEINRQGDLARQNLQAQAVRAGAFGGSREGIQRAELERGLSQTRNQAILNALQQGYGAAQQQSQQAFEQQKQRQLAQAQGLGNIGQGIGSLAAQQFGLGQSLAQGLGSLGTQVANLGVQQAAVGQSAQQLGQQDVNFLYGLGAQQQRQNQAELDALRATRAQEVFAPQQRLAFLSDIYKGAPSTQMAVTQQAQASPSPFQQIAGLGIAGLSAAAAANKAGIL